MTDEFPPDASVWPPALSRRQFIELAGASAALAGLAGCNRMPEKTIVPYVDPPDRELAGERIYYATAMPWEGFARGVLALSRSGRPTKLEGNPAHPDSLGATDAVTQAAVLSLYDPDRSQTPRQAGNPAAWDRFEDEWLDVHAGIDGRRGAGFALVTEPTSSPTMVRLIHGLLERWPQAKWFQHASLSRYDRGGRQVDLDFDAADVVLAVDADFLARHPSSLRYARAFAGRRRMTHGKINPNRLYVIEPTPTISGSMADHRLAASPARQRALLAGIQRALGAETKRGGAGASEGAAIGRGRETGDGAAGGSGLSETEARFVASVARDLKERAPKVLCVCGDDCDADIARAVDAINARLGADGVTVRGLAAVRSDGDSRCAGDLAAACSALRGGEVETIVVIGCNPAYTAPGDVDFRAAYGAAKRRIHLGLQVDETARLSDWHIPESHFLESWMDLRAFGGAATIVQPLISPLYRGRTAIELIAFLTAPPGRDGYDLVRDTWQARAPGADFELKWEGWLNQGIVDLPDLASSATAARGRFGPGDAGSAAEAPSSSELTLIVRPDPTVGDGRWGNVSWLQELPKPMTHLVWDNAVFVSSELAAQQGWERGDIVVLRTAAGAVRAPVWVDAKQARDCLTVFLGYGRVAAGRVGNGCGYDAYPLRHSARPWTLPLASVERAEGHVGLVTTQRHFTMEGRDLVHVARAADLASAERGPGEDWWSIYPQREYTAHKWAMLIDLSACIGCQACVAACQAENNVPVVGKHQVSLGREMHWLRVDTFYGEGKDEGRTLHQPVPCMQCENAPCELVCPVAATVHGTEGLNDMVFNRCVGTRYCSNNCPYKVRRFNFLNFELPADSPECLQHNPEVTVRSRGVMEKCTYCVQRIDDGRIAAQRDNRPIRDGEIRTACQQACPAEAIVFGDLNDPASRVRARKAEPTNYALMGELNTRPRTTYLAALVNPAPEP